MKVGKFTIKHKFFPCYFTWEGDDDWENVKDSIVSEIKNRGMEGFEAWENLVPNNKKVSNEEKEGYEKIDETKKTNEGSDKKGSTKQNNEPNENSREGIGSVRGDEKNTKNSTRGLSEKRESTLNSKKRKRKLAPRKPKLKRNH